MKYFILLSALLIAISCQNDKSQEVTKIPVNKEKTKQEPEGQRNRRGFPIGTIQEATQLLAGAKAKKTVINRRITDMIKDGENGALVLELGKPMEIIRPMMKRLDSITTMIEEGKEVDFLSDQDRAKIERRGQGMLEALIDSLSYLTSGYDQVLKISDEWMMEKLKKEEKKD